MPDCVVSISAGHAMSGLYLSPDMRFFAAYMLPVELQDVVQTVIHSRQPTTASYANFADCVCERYINWNKAQTYYQCIDMLMAAYSLITTQSHIDRGLFVAVDAAIGIHLRTICFPNRGRYPRIIPEELRDMRIVSPAHVDRDTFQRIFSVEPWLTWTERLRAQYNRLHGLLVRPGLDLAKELRHCAKIISDEERPIIKRAALHECPVVRRAIKRAYKLHARVKGTEDLRRFLHGKSLKIEGKHYKYRVQFFGSLLSGMVDRNAKLAPCSLDLFNQRDEMLGSACLYFIDTSIIDYLLNLRLYSSNERTELEMLNAMHITSATSAFYRDPILPKLKGITDPVVGPLHTAGNIEAYASGIEVEPIRDMYQNDFYHHAAEAFAELMHWPKNYHATLQRLTGFVISDIFAGADDMLEQMQTVNGESVS